MCTFHIIFVPAGGVRPCARELYRPRFSASSASPSPTSLSSPLPVSLPPPSSSLLPSYPSPSFYPPLPLPPPAPPLLLICLPSTPSLHILLLTALFPLVLLLLLLLLQFFPSPSPSSSCSSSPLSPSSSASNLSNNYVTRKTKKQWQPHPWEEIYHPVDGSKYWRHRETKEVRHKDPLY